MRKRRTGLALLAAGLSLAVALALTWANARLTRQLLRAQGQALERDPARAWHVEIEELTGGLSATVCRFRVYDRRGLSIEVSGRIRHRLLTASFEGDVYLLGAPGGPQRQRPEPGTGLATFATFQGQARYRPVSGVVWSARVRGQGGQLGMQGLNWTLQPWSAVLAGNSVSIGLDLPALLADGARLGGATIRGARLNLINVPQGAGGSAPQLSGEAQVKSITLRLPRVLVDASGVVMEARIERAPDGWPFDLQLRAAELVHRGFPFTRVSDLSYRVDGQASLLPRDGRRGVAAGSGALAWRSRHSLQADSDYGPLQGDALASGTLEASDLPRFSELRVTGLMPQGLWSVLQRLNAQSAAQFVGDGLVKLNGAEVSIRAGYRDGGWHALAAEP